MRKREKEREGNEEKEREKWRKREREGKFWWSCPWHSVLPTWTQSLLINYFSTNSLLLNLDKKEEKFWWRREGKREREASERERENQKFGEEEKTEPNEMIDCSSFPLFYFGHGFFFFFDPHSESSEAWGTKKKWRVNGWYEFLIQNFKHTPSLFLSLSLSPTPL